MGGAMMAGCERGSNNPPLPPGRPAWHPRWTERVITTPGKLARRVGQEGACCRRDPSSELLNTESNGILS